MNVSKQITRIVILIAALLVFSVNNSPVMKAEDLSNYTLDLPGVVEEIASGADILITEDPSAANITEKDSDNMHLNFVSGGSNHTHQYIIASAISILNHDKGNSVLNTYGTSLLYYTDWPDDHETDTGTFARHFYDPDTGKNWLGQSSPTAKTRAVQYYNNAVEEYRMGNIEEAFIHLGKGTHFVSDINVPHHASNLTALNSNHVEFEKYIDKNRLNYKVAGNTLAEKTYLEAVNTEVADLIQNTAVYAKSLANSAQQSSYYNEVGNKIVPRAITNNVQYIYKFCKEVRIF
ncbi:zinc dependent phospholipase C family protein [Paenibacillus tritici]|uniref:Phospholipase C n=1 Tax=Paenibacillus tritici TaxID=1873425 RepID=A0ABX2DVQ6_9BACL|nr:zinc dependent phospholipase C family protein [Paenibacillus tritici]NQX48490.1 zinc dependent phospholipase C family protein [Paenibacillus tritici]